MRPHFYYLRKQIWLIPTMFGLAAVTLSIASFYMDLLLIGKIIGYIPPILLTNVELGKDIMGILAAAILTMTTFTFSTVLVVLTTYSSQFSPRAPENFVHGQTTRTILGIFLGGFAYTSLSLLFMQDKTFGHEVLTPSIGILIGFICVGAFAYYIHFVSSNVQVTALVNKLTTDTEDVIFKYRKLQEENYVSMDKWEPGSKKNTVTADSEGYVQFIDLVSLVKFAEKKDIEIEVVVKTGDYIYKDEPIIHIHKNKIENKDLSDFYNIGSERTVEQDLGYAVQKLIEVAIRAISPSLNDPNTANDILLRVGRLLGEMGKLKTHGWVMTDSKDYKRVLYDFSSYKTILYETFYQISKYGNDDISVLAYMTDSLKGAAKSAPSMRYESLWEIQKYILDGLDCTEMKKMDRDYLQQKIDDLADMTKQKRIDLITKEET